MRKEMELEWAILKVLLLWHFHLVGGTQAAVLAVPKCPDRCGSITIPFPFGIGSKWCFLNEWYEIICEENDTIPRLKKIDAKVTKISLPYGPDSGPMSTGRRVNEPVGVPPNLQGSPFVYSARENVFLAAGSSNLLAVINHTGPILAGCRSGNTTRNFRNSGNCSDYGGCCETGISSLVLQEFGVNFLKEGELISNGDKECSYGFLANKSWLRPKLPDLQALIKGRFVPGVLDWGIPHNSSLGVQLSKICTNCVKGTISSLPYPLFEFYCRLGYTGYPYIVDGCEDVDECKDPHLNDCRDKFCENVPGTYHCRDTEHRRTMKFTMIGIGSVLGFVGLLLLVWQLYKTVKRKREIRRKEKFKRNGGIMLQQRLSSPECCAEKSKLFSSKELEKATNNFSEDRILGRGGQGTVYKGMLADGKIVAVKKSAAVDEAKVEQFVNEVLILTQVNHRNVVKLLGCCLETEVPLLVYEFIPNGTLYSYLHESNEEFSVSWDVRLRLATEVAGSLSYLHSAASIPIYHRDIKSSNILLDEKYRAKIADFGTSRSVSIDQTHVTTLVKGTFGYLDPEYFRSSQFTDKSDVYSFGVVLIELLTREKPISQLRVKEGRGLAAHFTISMEENRLPDILDPEILQQAKKEEILATAELAKRCLNLNGRMRPTMKEVAMTLEEIRKGQRPRQHSMDEAAVTEEHRSYVEFG